MENPFTDARNNLFLFALWAAEISTEPAQFIVNQTEPRSQRETEEILLTHWSHWRQPPRWYLHLFSLAAVVWAVCIPVYIYKINRVTGFDYMVLPFFPISVRCLYFCVARSSLKDIPWTACPSVKASDLCCLCTKGSTTCKSMM